MTSEETKRKVIDIIKKVDKLGWIQKKNGEPFMHLADVEKTIIALFDGFEMKRIDQWVKDKETEEYL